MRLTVLGGGNLSVLASQVSDLTGLGLGGVTRSDLTTAVRVKMSLGTSAVTVGGDGLVVNVVPIRTQLALETAKLDGDFDTMAARASDEGETTSHALGSVESSGVASRGMMSERRHQSEGDA